MLFYAVTNNGTPIFPERFAEVEWETLKETYRVGDFLTPCCGAPAIPKTSMYMTRFFAHHSDECATSPESIWHISSKERIARELGGLGLQAVLEKPIAGSTGNLKSDVYFEVGGRRIAIEVQHSYQNFRDYQKRQSKYVANGVENYWVLYRPRYMTVTKSIWQYRVRHEFAGKVPADGKVYPALPDIPIVFFDPEEAGGVVRAAGFICIPIREWLASVVSGRFAYKSERWEIG